MGNEGAVAKLKEFASLCHQFLQGRPSIFELRCRLERLGKFYRVDPLPPKRRVVAVDGSLGTVGSHFPYFLVLMQAVAFALPPLDSPLVEHEVFSPLKPEVREYLEERAQKERGAPDLMAEQRVRELMTALELRVALQVAEALPGALVLLDGGFVPFRNRAGELFQALCERALEGGVLLVGVIEEIASRRLGEAVGLGFTGFSPHDREVLYGCLDLGEVFELEEDEEEPFIRVFARFGHHPQPVAFDFLREQKEFLPEILGVLRALTPADGRGIPSLIDLADRYVRLQAAEVERLVAVTVPPELREVFLSSHRRRRPF
ncbi:NurA domain protein [Ammonifex degensii KC4]|uniref:NurA domain protein n=1 Tax=Ammonifex degensii (strain DSM 10501 / KC4) TaxID=429009 RepID=C9R963_AMMDK|nr:DNA double-strand break repair nuclease NurA [Ammonifex degensii]ACX52842.1 NurA domain protein [Ammonifex degensii KC4]